jgi:hypothetical protein
MYLHIKVLLFNGFSTKPIKLLAPEDRKRNEKTFGKTIPLFPIALKVISFQIWKLLELIRLQCLRLILFTTIVLCIDLYFIYIYICIYLSVCVCVCVCNNGHTISFILKKNGCARVDA